MKSMTFIHNDDVKCTFQLPIVVVEFFPSMYMAS
jgi:hypothetical protein